jgi:predicted transcriptional regulator
MSQQKTISFRMDAGKVDALDEIAVSTQRDRTFLLNEAIDAWLDLNAYHRQLVEDGMQDAREGRVVESAEMRLRLEQLKGRRTA